jgi:hypothetical protein
MGLRKKKRSTPLILTWRRLPVRISSDQTADYLNCHVDAVGNFVRLKLLPPLDEGVPPWFSTKEVMELAEDRKWLAKITRVERLRVKAKNEKQKKENQ